MNNTNGSEEASQKCSVFHPPPLLPLSFNKEVFLPSQFPLLGFAGILPLLVIVGLVQTCWGFPAKPGISLSSVALM